MEGPGLDRDPDSKRDSTVLTIVSIDTTQPDTTRYHVLHRFTWNNVDWSATLQPALLALMLRWNPVITLVDATGIGFGLYTHLHAANRGKANRVEPFVFSSKSKSDLGWRLVSMIDAGRIDVYAHDGADDTVEFWRQLAHTLYEIRPGEGKLMKWGVPANIGHDDSVLSMALVAELDRLDPTPRIARGT